MGANGAFTLGVIGHVDHGKTALVRALTGIETDRLEEERARGLSIVLGFAFLSTPHGIVDLIDVPGHEDFVRAMIGGATALDAVVLCIAATEGVMPQTLEHFQIARLLGVAHGFVAITKADLVDDERLAAVREEVAGCVQGTFLEDAPVLEASVASGEGLEAVREAIGRLAAEPVERDAGGPFFMPLDRVFTMRGFGLVVTGTLRAGELCNGDAVEIFPSRKSSTVRGLQNHGRPIERAMPGQRVAVNLRQLGRDDVARGDVLAAPGSITPAARLDVELHVLEDADRAVKNGAVLRVLTGTTEAMGRVRLLSARELAPGESAFAQLQLDRLIATKPSERLLVRMVSPLRTIGGGRILAVDTKRHRRFDASVTERLATAASGDVERIAARRLVEAGGSGVRLSALAAELGMERDAVARIVTRLGTTSVARSGTVSVDDDLVVASSAFDALLHEIVTLLERFHREHPLKKGLDVGSLTHGLPSKPSPEVVQRALERLVEHGRVQSASALYGIAGHDPFARLSERERKLVDEMEQAFLAAGLQPPPVEAVVGSERVKQVIYRLLLETGKLVRLRTYDKSADIVLHAKTLEQVEQAIALEFPYPSAFAVKDVRDLLGSTRKHIVPVMEHFDASGMTVRNGDLRRLRAP